MSAVIDRFGLARAGEESSGLGRVATTLSVVMLGAASACSFVDRQIMSLLVGPIQADLKLTDTGVSLLLGLAFVLSYALAGPPIGLVIDRRPRWGIISAGIAVWSVMTAACALAAGYWQLFLCRMGVGIGEATLNPAAYSLLPDLVRRERLGVAFATFGLGVYAGAGLALLIGGQVIGLLTTQPAITLPMIGTIRSWQAVFLMVATLGVPLAIIARLLPEPRRTGSLDVAAPPVREVLTYFRAHLRPIGAVVACWAFIYMAGYGVGAWLPTFLIRSFGWTPMKVGLWFGLTIVVGGGAGAVCGGFASDYFAARRRTGRVSVLALLTLPAVPAAIAFPLVASPALALALAGVFTFLQAAASSVAPAALQDIVPSRMRGLGSALALTVTTLLGLGLGPTLVALVTDHVFADKAMLRWSLAVVVPLMLVSAIAAAIAALPTYSTLKKEITG